MAAVAENDLPLEQIIVRHRGGIEARGPPPKCEPLPLFETVVDGRAMGYSQDGTLLGLAAPDCVVVIDSTTGEELARIDAADVRAVRFSPLNTFVVTFQRHFLNQESGNIKVWDMDTCEEVANFSMKETIPPPKWGPQWSDDEALCGAITCKNEVKFFNGRTMDDNYLKRLHLVGVADFEISRGEAPYHVAFYLPETKNEAGVVMIIPFSDLDPGAATARKGFFNADNCEMKWNAQGTALLVFTSTDVDKSGSSYYGETNLYFLQADGQFETGVELVKDGPIYTYEWSPNGREFIVVHGTMPAKAILFNSRCVAKFDFGTAHRNTVSYSPHGRFICIAGFGNLAGQMDFWDRNKLKKIGSASAPLAHLYSWSPSGRHFMTACIAPRMQVDHGFQVWKYDGTLVIDSRIDQLYGAVWRPALDGVFPDRPMSPRAGGSANGGAGDAAEAPAAAPTGKYIPPGARRRGAGGGRGGRGGGLSGRDILHADSNTSTGPKKISTPVSEESKLTKSQLKNQKRREKKKREAMKKAAEEELAALQADTVDEDEPAAEAGAAEPALVAPPLPEGEEAIAKRIRAVRKKLREIARLEEQQAEGQSLTGAQVTKVGGKALLELELANLEAAEGGDGGN